MEMEDIMKKSYLKEFFDYTFLSTLGTIGVSCYILADTFFISQSLKADGLTALNLAIPVYNFIHGTGLMLGIGGATKFSIYKSQNKQAKINCLYTNTILLALVFTVIFTLGGLFFSNTIARMLGANDQVLIMTDTYLKWLMLFSGAFILNDVLLCYVRNDGNPQLSMLAMLIGSFANIVLDYVFIFPMQMGIFGAILATGLSPIISIIIMAKHWLSKKKGFYLVKTIFRFTLVKDILSLGFPSLIVQLSSGIVMIIFNLLIGNITGNRGIAAYGVVANISLVIVSIYTGIAQGIQPIISYAFGKQDKSKILAIWRYTIISVGVISVVLYALLFVNANKVVTVFNSGNDLKLQLIAVEGIKIYFLSNLFVGYNTVLAIFFTSIEQALPAHLLSLLKGFIIIIPLAFILSALYQMTGIWLTYPLTELIVAVLGYLWYCFLKKKIINGEK